MTSRTALARFDIQAEADLHAAVLNIQLHDRLRSSFKPVDLVMIATVASELGRNILKYGGGKGYLLLSWVKDAITGRTAVEIKAIDFGPGFADREAALRDHYSTGGTLGLGLPGASRIMDTLEIDSTPGKGAVVTATKWVQISTCQPSRIESGFYVRPCEGETVSGDAVFVQPTPSGMFAAVIDVLGHGSDAHKLTLQLTEALSRWLREAPLAQPETALGLLHECARGTRGAVAAVAWLNANTLTGSVSGIGNVRCRLFGTLTQTVEFGDGVLGQRMRSPKSVSLALKPADVIVLFSDGVAGRFHLSDYPSLNLDPAPTIAFNIVQRFGRSTDDASCAVMRCR